MLQLPDPSAGPPAVIGHRGASARARDNSREAFHLAASEGADGVELDVRRTRDGAMVVAHDPEIAEVGAIHAMTASELRAGAPWLLTLDEAMAACAGMWVNIEIKSSPAEDGFDEERRLADQVVDWVRHHEAVQTVIVSSFDPLAADRVRELAPEIATGLLVSPATSAEDGIHRATSGGHQAINFHDSHLRPDASPVVDRANARGLAVVVWTVDDPDRMRALADAGVAGVITNDPAGAVAALRPSS